MNVAVQHRSGHNLVMDLDKLTKKTGIKKSFLASLIGYKHRESFARAEREGFSDEKTQAYLDALTIIKREIEREFAKTEKRLRRAA